MLLPHDKSIDVKVLAQIYNNTTATYKFYWFASILDILVKEGKNRMSFWEIIVGMIAEAWYPIHWHYPINCVNDNAKEKSIVKFKD